MSGALSTGDHWRSLLQVCPVFAGIMTVALLTINLFPVSVRAQMLLYSFEPDTEGFLPNGFPSPTVSQDTIGATEGSSSLKIEVPSPGTFVGALSQLVTDIVNPPGIDHVLFDLTITEPFSPPPPAAPGFAVIGITMFGHGGGQFGLQAQFSDTEAIDGKPAGTYRDLRINLNASAGPYRLGESFNDIFCTDVTCDPDDLLPSGFQFFLNKFGSPSDHPLTVYIDNVRIVPPPAAVPGDYNNNGAVDAADYVLWRNNGPLQNEVADPGTISAADYTEWRARFGNPSAGSGNSLATVPEPTAVFGLIAAAAWILATRRGIAGR